MHLAEGVLPLVQALAWGTVALPIVGWSLRGEASVRQDKRSSSALMAGATSLLFAATLLPLPVPVVGATSHICLTPVLALIVGLRQIIWPTFFVLLLQAIFFAHGGITTLGVNTITLGLLGPLAAVALWTAFRKLGVNSVFGLALACGLGGLTVYMADAIVLALALADVSPPFITFGTALLGFAPVQVPLAVVEAIVSVGIVKVLAHRRPDLLPDSLLSIRNLSYQSATALSIMCLMLSGCDYQGIDGSVFGATAERSGRPPTESLLDLSQGELGLSMTILILFGLGFVAGRSWERLLGSGRDALSP